MKRALMEPFVASRAPGSEVGPDPEPPARSAPALPTPVLLTLAALSAAITAQGGYYAGGALVTGALLAAGLLSAAWDRSLFAHDLTFPPVLAAAALGAWTVLVAVAVGGDPLPILALLGGVCAALVVCRRTSPVERDAMAGALVAIGALVALSGWAGVAWRIDPLALEDQGLWRAATSLTYANAAAGLLVPLVLLSLGRQMARASPARGALTCLLLVGAGATLSRGGGLALLVGLAALAALGGAKPTLRALLAPAVGAVVALAGVAPSMPVEAGARPALALAALAAGVLGAIALGRAPAKVLAAVVVLVGLAAAISLSAVDGASESLRGSRLTLASSDRRAETAAALDLVAERPLTGTGPGRATLFFAGADGQPLAARYVHNEYLQVLAELGVVGLALVLVLFATLAAAVRAERRPAPSPAQWAGAAAGLIAFSAHSALDFLWHVPALPLAAALLVGLTISATPTAKEHA